MMKVIEQARKLLELERLPLSALYANGVIIDLYEWAHALQSLSQESVRSEALGPAYGEILGAAREELMVLVHGSDCDSAFSKSIGRLQLL